MQKKNLQKLSDQFPIIMLITTSCCHCCPEITFITGGSRACIYSISRVNPTRCNNFSNLFCFRDNTLHGSDGLSIHHQEFKTVHTATGICQADGSICLTYTCCCMYSLELLVMCCIPVGNVSCMLLSEGGETRTSVRVQR